MVISHSRPILPLGTFTKIQSPIEGNIVGLPLTPPPIDRYDYTLVVFQTKLFFLTVNDEIT